MGWAYPSAEWVRKARRLADLETRLAAAVDEHAALEGAPAAVAARRVDALDSLEAAEAAHRRVQM